MTASTASRPTAPAIANSRRICARNCASRRSEPVRSIWMKPVNSARIESIPGSPIRLLTAAMTPGRSPRRRSSMTAVISRIFSSSNGVAASSRWCAASSLVSCRDFRRASATLSRADRYGAGKVSSPVRQKPHCPVSASTTARSQSSAWPVRVRTRRCSVRAVSSGRKTQKVAAVPRATSRMAPASTAAI